MNKLQYDMFMKKASKPYTYTDYFKWHEHELTSTLLFVLKMYIQRLNYQVFPMKRSEAFQIWTKCVGNKWEGNWVPLGERKLECTLTKEPQNYISHFVWYGATMFKTQQLKPYKRKKHNICSFQKVHKHSLIQNELVSTFTLKKYQTILVS